MSNAPFDILLDARQAEWELQGPGVALVGFLSGNGTVEKAAAFRIGGGIEAKLKALGVTRGRVKAVCDESFAGELQRVLVAAGFEVERIVARAGGFTAKFLPESGKLLVAAAEAPARTRVLIVDDSPTIRKLLVKILASDPELEVVGDVGLPSEAEAAIERLRPDVITLDIHLPEMNGVELLQRYLAKHPVPTVMISSISMEEGPLVLGALEVGAVDYIQKPSAHDLAVVSPLIVAKVKAARGARVRRSMGGTVRRLTSAEMDPRRLIAVGSSTGGTEALKDVLLGLPEKIPPIVVVQHIPAVFSKAFADRLDALCPFRVVEAADGEPVEPGKVIIAPGGKQMSIRKSSTGYVMRVDDSAPVNRHKPSVDVLFHSVAKEVGASAVGLILTGMGADGAQGLFAMKKAGSATFAQNEATCVVYGMPQAAYKVGAVDRLVPLGDLAAALVATCAPKTRKTA